MNKNRLFEHITRSVLKRLTLNESDDRADRVKDVIDATFKDILKLDNVVSSPEYYVGNNEKTTWRSYLYFNLRRSFGLMTNGDLSILDFIAPIAYSNEVKFDIDDSKVTEQNKLKEIVLILKDKPNGLFENKLKGKKMTFAELCEITEPYIQQKKQQEEEELANGDFSGGRDYEILEDVDFKTAKRYGDMSCSEGRICYTQGKSTWDDYKGNDKNKCYILLHKDWKTVEEEHTEPLYDFLPYNAYDEYGLSMIFVFVNQNNEISTSNTRWNHHAKYGNRGCDKALSKVDISKLIGKSFNDVFKGYSKKDGAPIVTIENAQELLDKGYNPEDVFENIFPFNEGFARVELNGVWNYINTDGRIISDQWFYRVGIFDKGIAEVKSEDGWNFINREGKLISDQWFDYSYGFNEGFAVVELNGKYNHINTEGELLSDKGFDYALDFNEGFAVVELNGKHNYINTEGELLSDKGFDLVSDFRNGFGKVMTNGKWYKIDREGNIIE